MVSSGILEYCSKIKDRIKGSVKSACSCNWPEPSKYCGCCSLPTGIYIRSVVMIILSITNIGLNGSILSHLWDIDELIININHTEIENADIDWNDLYFMYRVIIVHYIFWICFKCVYTLIIFSTIYAIYKKNAKMLKYLVYISVPYLIMNLIVTITDVILLARKITILLLIFVLSETYNILAMNSQYKILRGKSRLVVEYSNEMDTYTEQIYPCNVNEPQRDLRFRSGNHQSHCRSCTCYASIIDNPPDYVSNGEIEAPVQTTISEPTANSAVTSNIVNQEASSYTNENGIEMRDIDIVEENIPNTNVEVNETATSPDNKHPARPVSLNLNNNVKDIKVDLSDAPVIYDERQLSVGTSPVIEERIVTTNLECTQSGI